MAITTVWNMKEYDDGTQSKQFGGISGGDVASDDDDGPDSMGT